MKKDELLLADALAALIKTGETPREILNHLQCHYHSEAAGESSDPEARAANARRAEIAEDAFLRLMTPAS